MQNSDFWDWGISGIEMQSSYFEKVRPLPGARHPEDKCRTLIFGIGGLVGLKCKAAISKRSDLSLGLVILKTNAEL
jgi:hypothetical protein